MGLLANRQTAIVQVFQLSLVIFCALAVSLTSVFAQQSRLPVVRDAEIEQLVKEYAAPILRASGLSNAGIEIIIINDSSFNAFVNGRRIFINVGALLMSETPNEIIGVIAHEAGHIAGGHLFRLREQMERAQTMAVLSTLLGAGAMVAGATSGQSGLAQAGGGIAAGGAELAKRGFLAYQRTEESAADRSAIEYLNATKQSGIGMLKTFERLGRGTSLLSNRPDPYQLSHPLPRDRVLALEQLVMESPYANAKDSPALQLRHDMMRAKIAAYTQGASAVRRLSKDRSSISALYGEAMLAHLAGSPADALRKIDTLISKQPKNAYFHELKGDALIRANKPDQAVQAYSAAIKLEPVRSNLIRMNLGQAYLSSGNPQAALKVILEGMAYDDRNAAGYQTLAQTYGQLGQIPQAELATAEMHFYAGQFGDARVFAGRAQQKLPQNSPEWRRAQDIINFKQIR